MPVDRLLRALLACFALCSSHALAADISLPHLGADPAKVSVSGLSSGAVMAIQYEVAYSASVMGVGVVAGVPYNCALTSGPVPLANLPGCMGGSPSGAVASAAANGLAGFGQIDDPANIARHKVYLFSGTKDEVVKPTTMNAVADFYRDLHVQGANLAFVNDVPAGHAFISAVFGSACGTSAKPYVNQCMVGGVAYDQPRAILTHIYGALQPKVAALSSAPVSFDQTELAPATAGMAKTGYVYVPAACAAAGAAKCAVHVVFHGCGQSAKMVSDAVYGKVGYNEWADSNHIILLYPQVDPQPNAFAPAFNPYGCWDWWGTTGFNFQSRSGAQLSAVHAMIQRLLK